MDLATKPNILHAFSKPNIGDPTKPNFQEEYRGKGDDGKKLIILEKILDNSLNMFYYKQINFIEYY